MHSARTHMCPFFIGAPACALINELIANLKEEGREGKPKNATSGHAKGFSTHCALYRAQKDGFRRHCQVIFDEQRVDFSAFVAEQSRERERSKERTVCSLMDK